MWLKKPVKWIIDDTLYISIVFTWDLPSVLFELQQRSFLWRNVVVGGPAVKLIPGFFKSLSYVTEEEHYRNAIKLHNKNATFTSRGCIRKCSFCAVPKIEGSLLELHSWPDGNIICDNNLLACSFEHFIKVINCVRPDQVENGWSNKERLRIMRFFYKHSGVRLI